MRTLIGAERSILSRMKRLCHYVQPALITLRCILFYLQCPVILLIMAPAKIILQAVWANVILLPLGLLLRVWRGRAVPLVARYGLWLSLGVAAVIFSLGSYAYYRLGPNEMAVRLWSPSPTIQQPTIDPIEPPLLFYLTCGYESLCLFVPVSKTLPKNLATSEDIILTACCIAAPIWTALAVISLLFRDLSRRLRILTATRRIIICGLGQTGYAFVKRYVDQHDTLVIVIEKDNGNPLIKTAEQLGAIVIIGNAESPEVMRSSGASRAERILILCGNDSTNLTVAGTLENYIAKSHSSWHIRLLRWLRYIYARVIRGWFLPILPPLRPLECAVYYVHLENLSLWESFRHQEIAEIRSTYDFQYVNLCEIGAKLLLDRRLAPAEIPETRNRGVHPITVWWNDVARICPAIRRILPARKKPDQPDKEDILRPQPPAFPRDHMSLAFIGFGPTNRSLLVEVARRRYKAGLRTSPLQVHVLDAEATALVENIKQEYPRIEEVLNIVPRDCRYQGNWSDIKELPRYHISIFIDTGSDATNRTVGVKVSKHVRESDSEMTVILTESAYLAEKTEDNGGLQDHFHAYKHMKPFYLLQAVSKPGVIDAFSLFGRLAIVTDICYGPEESIPGMDYVLHNTLELWRRLQKNTNRAFARDIPRKLQHIGYRMMIQNDWDLASEGNARLLTDNVVAREFCPTQPSELNLDLPKDEHDRWNTEQYYSGWCTGLIRMNSWKIHNCLVPWQALLEKDKNKDRLMVKYIPRMLHWVDLKAEKTDNN